jgi:hypothetical protein
MYVFLIPTATQLSWFSPSSKTHSAQHQQAIPVCIALNLRVQKLLKTKMETKDPSQEYNILQYWL